MLKTSDCWTRAFGKWAKAHVPLQHNELILLCSDQEEAREPNEDEQIAAALADLDAFDRKLGLSPKSRRKKDKKKKIVEV